MIYKTDLSDLFKKEILKLKALNIYVKHITSINFLLGKNNFSEDKLKVILDLSEILIKELESLK